MLFSSLSPPGEQLQNVWKSKGIGIGIGIWRTQFFLFITAHMTQTWLKNRLTLMYCHARVFTFNFVSSLGLIYVVSGATFEDLIK